LAVPITAPPAANAPTMPISRPRTSLVLRMNRNASRSMISELGLSPLPALGSTGTSAGSATSLTGTRIDSSGIRAIRMALVRYRLEIRIEVCPTETPMAAAMDTRAVAMTELLMGFSAEPKYIGATNRGPNWSPRAAEGLDSPVGAHAVLPMLLDAATAQAPLSQPATRTGSLRADRGLPVRLRRLPVK